MSLALLLPLGLLALASLLLPLLVHLARRSERHTVTFAALQWLQARPQPRSRRRFEEWWLLALRLLLLALLALLLAEPVLHGRPDLAPRVLVAPGVDLASARRAGPDDARWHWLAPGFPLVSETDGRAPEGAPAPSSNAGTRARAVGATTSSLLRDFDAGLPPGAALTVLVPPVLDGVDAEVPVLSRRVDWRVVDGARDAAAPVPAVAPLRVMVRHAPTQTAALRYLRAVEAAWRLDAASTRQRMPPFDIAPSTAALDPNATTLVWLVPGPLPAAVQAWITAGGTALVGADTTLPAFDAAPIAWRDAHGVLARGRALGRGRILQLARAWQPAAMPVLLDPGFPAQVRALLAAPPAPPARVAARDHAPRLGGSAQPAVPTPLAPWLAVLVALLFVVERWLANGPRQQAVP